MSCTVGYLWRCEVFCREWKTLPGSSTQKVCIWYGQQFYQSVEGNPWEMKKPLRRLRWLVIKVTIWWLRNMWDDDPQSSYNLIKGFGSYRTFLWHVFCTELLNWWMAHNLCFKPLYTSVLRQWQKWTNSIHSPLGSLLGLSIVQWSNAGYFHEGCIKHLDGKLELVTGLRSATTGPMDLSLIYMIYRLIELWGQKGFVPVTTTTMVISAVAPTNWPLNLMIGTRNSP